MLNATAELASVRGVRRAALQELYTPQGKSALAPDELILRFQIDRLDGYTGRFTIYDSSDSERVMKDILRRGPAL